jgi:xanthine dehydrogenase small subunit
METQPIQFFHRGALQRVSGSSATRSVLDWLREDARCTGTKEGCNEGDCGACTVVIGELAEPGDPAAVRGLKLQTVNACIQFLPTLHGKALFTVEDLKAGDTLHPVQQAMVDCHGSQCGFCTPGFVMSMWSAYERGQACGKHPSRRQMADELSGNLCRCTGYRPILDASERMFELPKVALDTAPVVAALRTMARDGVFQPGGFHAPRSIEQLAALREQKPQATLLAGCTDIGLWVNKQFRELGEIIYLGDVAELKRIHVDGGALRIGAGASLEAAWNALATEWPSLREMGLRFASPPIRNAGTMGGNVANGSPIGDSAPVLIALDARIALRRGGTAREMPLADFYVDYMKNRLQAGEFVEAIIVPHSGAEVRAYKISKRFDCDISAVAAGMAITLDGDTVHDVRLAFGGMAAIVKRAALAEAALRGQPWTRESVDAAKAALARDFTPLTDMRASAAYRMTAAQNLIERFWLETRTADPLPRGAIRVWDVQETA